MTNFPKFRYEWEKWENWDIYKWSNFRDSWFFLTFLTYKLSNFGEFEGEIFLNFGISKKSEKIETFISENFRSSWFFLTILTYKIFDFHFKKLKANFGISEKIEKIETFISENLKIFGYDLNFLIWTPPWVLYKTLRQFPIFRYFCFTF